MAREISSRVPEIVLSDPGLAAVMDQMHRVNDASPSWLEGEVAAVVARTLQDYLEDLKTFLEKPLYR